MASTAPVVEIGSSQEGKSLEITLDGQQKTIVLWADAEPANVTFQWELVGSGSLTSDSKASIQYVSPQSVDGEEEVVINVQVTDAESGLVASDRVIIRLLSAAPTAAVPTDTPIPESGALELPLEEFIVQDVDNGQEFFLDTRFGAVPMLPFPDGVDLGAYLLELTFQGGDGKEAQLFFKDSRWASVYSVSRQIVSGQAIRFDPFADRQEVSDFDDFEHIYAVGAKIWGGVQDVKILSARLIRRDGSASPAKETATPEAAQTATPLPSEPTSEPDDLVGIQLRPADFVVQGDEFFLDTRYGAIPDLAYSQDQGVDLRGYALELTFQGGDGKSAQIFFKNSTWANVYSASKPIASGQPVRFDPVTDRREVSDFDSFEHIYAIGAKILQGIQGIEITSARLIER